LSGRCVLDASAAVHLVLRSAQSAALIRKIEAAALVLAPSLYCSETSNAIWKYVRAGQLDRTTGIERCEEARQLIDRFTPDCELHVEAFSLAAQTGHPVYDAIYATLARRHGASVMTLDRRLSALLQAQGIDAA